MSYKCEICGKGPVSGNAVSHSNRRTKRRWKPNLQDTTIIKDGRMQKVRICTRCLRSLSHQK